MYKSISIQRNGETLSRITVDVVDDDDDAELEKIIGKALVDITTNFPNLINELNVAIDGVVMID